MNNFYIDLFNIACRETEISPNDVPNRNDIINKAIEELTEKEQDFIGMIKPLYLENDPNGKYSMSYIRQACDAFRMSKNEIKNYRHEVKHNLISNMKNIILKQF